jgi:hypothetical protein
VYAPTTARSPASRAAARVQFQVWASPYKDLIVHGNSLELQTPSTDCDQPDELNTVRVVQDDTFHFVFGKNGITYDVQSLPEDATSTLDILKSWQFI